MIAPTAAPAWRAALSQDEMFQDRRASFVAFELPERRQGDLVVFTEIRVKGDHRAGPVPVTIEHCFRFRYHEPWFDSDGNEILCTSRSFESPHERNMYVSNHFEVEGDWKKFEGSFGG